MKTALSVFLVATVAIILSIAAVGIIPAAGEKAATGIDFDGTNDYVTFGVASDLGASTFTIETWFKREGTGKTTTTGTGGITKAIPLVTKGRGEAEASNKDMNYFLGIDSTLSVLAADFEEGAGGASPGLNHPIKGVTPIVTGYWYHAAVTYDGTKWQLFLNGGLEKELTVGQPPRFDSIQHAGLATAMTSTGAAAGYFNGLLDEVRIWNRAKSQQAIQDSMYLELTSGSGLLGRWGLNEGSGTTANNSVGGGSNGTLTNGPLWVSGSPFELKALDFGTGTAYVTFGDPAALDLAEFTLETWFRRDGAGTRTSTGTGGITKAIPLVTKGRGEADGDNRDMNYFLGIDDSTDVLAADFEEGAGGASPGLNHPIRGLTVISNNVWYHVAATYDGTTWKLYLNGLLQDSLVVGQPPRWDSIQHAGLGTGLNSTGVAAGHFDGVLDEVRIWDYARTQAQIQATINDEITASQSGLVARWGLNEAYGDSVYGSAGTTVGGSIKNSGYGWVPGAPFDITSFPPDAPTALDANAVSYHQIDLSWTDNSDNELNFEIERSAIGAGGPFTQIDTVAADITTYSNYNLLPETEYWYRVRATNAFGNSIYSNVDSATTLTEGSYALDFGTGTAYTTFGDPAALDLAVFTIETWFKREGAGTRTSTGSGGITKAIPLVTKGRGEADGDNRDMNYFFGIDDSTDVIVADFEEGAGGSSPGLNHPVIGHTVIVNDTWYHAAATYDGTTWRLYLNGSLEADSVIGQPPRWDSIQHAGLATAMTSTGSAAGHFDGVLDEARIWSYARSDSAIVATMNSQLSAPQTGLVARWGLNEGSGNKVYGGAGTAVNGNITNTGYSWVTGAPFNLPTEPPDQPDLVQPPDMGTGVSTSPTLEVSVSDLDEDTLTVTFYGRATTEAGADFTLVILPDTQFYSAEMNGGTLEIFQDQTQWIIDKKDSLNIVYVAQLGDCVQNGDTYLVEWERADTAMSTLETILPPDGMPFGVAVGNHDQTPGGDPTGTTTYFNQFFGESRFSGRAYYGGHYGSNNDNQCQLFSAGGLSFIVLFLEYDTTPDSAILDWADSLLAAHSTRQGIVISHNLIGTGDPGSFSAQGTAIYNALRDNPNLFLMHCGHTSGEGKRTDVYNGNTVHTLLADYQDRTNGGGGWLRILEFSPANNQIQVRTYSPVLDSSETDANSQFVLSYDMEANDFSLIGTDAGVPSGSNASIVWPGLSPSTEYEWYAEVSDGIDTTIGPVWSFTTGSPCTLTVNVVGQGDVLLDPPGGIYNQGTDVELTAVPDSGWAFDGWSGDLTGGINPDTLAMSGNKTVTATFYTQPSAVENLSIQPAFEASGAGSQDLWLAWSPVDDDTAGTPIVIGTYVVYRDTVPSFVPGPATEYDTTTDTTYLDVDAAGDSSVNYYYYINARKGSLESDDSQCVGEFDRDLLSVPKLRAK